MYGPTPAANRNSLPGRGGLVSTRTRPPTPRRAHVPSRVRWPSAAGRTARRHPASASTSPPGTSPHGQCPGTVATSATQQPRADVRGDPRGGRHRSSRRRDHGRQPGGGTGRRPALGQRLAAAPGVSKSNAEERWSGRVVGQREKGPSRAIWLACAASPCVCCRCTGRRRIATVTRSSSTTPGTSSTLATPRRGSPARLASRSNPASLTGAGCRSRRPGDPVALVGRASIVAALRPGGGWMWSGWPRPRRR